MGDIPFKQTRLRDYTPLQPSPWLPTTDIRTRWRYKEKFLFMGIEMSSSRWTVAQKESEAPSYLTYNFYGINTIDFNRNTIPSLWIYCDIIDPSYVGNVKLPLMQIVPTTTANVAASFERFGMLHRKRINRARVTSIKIWITETFDGKPIHFNGPVTISVEYA